MKRLPAWSMFVALAVAAIAGVLVLRLHQPMLSVARAEIAGRVGCQEVVRDFADRRSNLWATMSGRVNDTLPDSYGQYRHQRFVVSCPSGQTVLVENDVSVGTRVPVSKGARVAVKGIYIWNSEGGLLHFTHGGATGGWILFRRRLYY